MTGEVFVSVAAVGLAVVLLMPSRAADRRLLALTTRSPKPTSRGRVRTPEFARRTAVALAAGVVALLVGGPMGLLAAAVVGFGLLRAFSRLEPAVRRERRRAIELDLPIALDLLGACLSAGTPVSDAVRVVAAGVGGPVGAEFDAVVAALDVGVAPAEAWQALPQDGFGAVGRVLARATTSGAPVADIAGALAEERRSALQVEAAAAARRAGVAAVGPLGLCFLPAFLCSAVVPVVAGLATRVLA
jgi:Flp pilus assembly protein TadB